MKLFKLCLATGVMAVCIQAPHLQAAETPAQSLAREALQKKMQELQPVTTPPQPTTPAPPATPVAAPAAPIVRTTKTPPPPPPPAAMAAPTPAESAAIIKAREALERKMNELNAVPETATTQPAVLPKPAAVAVPPPVAVTPHPTPAAAAVAAPVVVPPPPSRPAGQQAAPVTPSVDSAKVAKAREALREKMQEVGPATPAEAAPMAMEPPKKANKSLLVFPPIAGPPSPLSGTKQVRLNELLRRYQADELSPQQYHAERAKLISEP